MSILSKKPIVSAMTLPVLGALSACTAGYYLGTAASIFVEDMSSDSRYKFEAPDHYEPIVTFANDRIIRVKYLDNDGHAQPDEAMQIIGKHCDDSFLETGRRTSHGVTYVEAECVQAVD